MCFNSKNANQTSQTTSAPPWWTNQAQNVVSNAAQFATGEYTPYGGQRVAGFEPDQLNAFQGVRDTQGIADPYMQAAGNYATLGAAPVTTQQILDQYNPYIDAQVNQYQQDANYRGQLETQGLNSQIAQQGALTGDRGQVARQLAAESRNRVDSNNVANIRSQGYNEATRIAESNRDAARSGAGQFSQLGSTAQNLAYNDANALLGSGGLQQQYQQAMLDVPYQEYLAAQAKPYEDANFQASLLGAVQGGAGSTTTKTTPQPSKFSQYLGLGSTLGSMAIKAAPMIMAASDERVKTDISEIGKTHDGLPIYSFKMPGDETGGQQTKIGLMAQDVAQVKPEAVGHMGGGLLGVDYKRATEDAEGMASGGPVDRFAFASKAGDLGHFQNVDPDLARMASTLGQAVEAIKKHSGPGAGDYHRGKSEGQMVGHEEGFAKGGEVERGETRLKEMERKLQETEKRSAEYAKRLDGIERTSSMKTEKMAAGGDVGMGVPSPITAGALPFKAGPAGYVPKIQLSPSAQMHGGSAPDMPSSGGGGGQDSLGTFKQFGNDAIDYFKPKMDMGINDWAAGTTVTPAGFYGGGDVGKSPIDAGTLPFYANDSGVPGISVGDASYVPDVSKTKNVAPHPIPLSGLGVPDNTDTTIQPRDTSGKAWYENAGDYLGDFGAGAMSGDSPYGLINVGHALTGANALNTRRLQEEQEQRNKERAANAQAARLKQEAARYSQEFGLKERQQTEAERHNKAVEAKGEAAPASVREYLFAKENGFKGGFTDFIKAQKGDESKPAIAKEYEYAVANGFKGSFQDYQSSRKPDGIPNTLQTEAAKADGAWNVLSKELNDYELMIAGSKDGEQQYDDQNRPISGTGTNVMPFTADRDKVDQKRRNIQLQLKELYNLGVLNGPDLALMDQMLFDPSLSLLNPGAAVSPEKRTQSSVANLKTMMKRLRDEKVKAGANSPRNIQQNSSRDDTLQQARDAIAGGADRNAVIERLKSNGVDPEGL